MVIYSTSRCGYRKQEAKRFGRHNIPFRGYDAGKSSKGKVDYKMLKGRGVPIILIGRRRTNGFDAQSFDRIYRAGS